ncbi:hypothetical protein Tco_1508135 [Tanacetum coccineum]
MELVMAQIQQGTGYEVSVSAKGVKELKRKGKIKGEKKEAILALRQKLERLATSAGNPVKEILLKLNLPDHKSILTDLKVTLTKHGRMTKPYSFPRFIANCFNAGYLKMEVKISATLIPYIFLEVTKISRKMVTLAFEHQEQYEHVGSEVTRSQEGKEDKMANRDYAWLMILRSSKDLIQVKNKIQAKA